MLFFISMDTSVHQEKIKLLLFSLLAQVVLTKGNSSWKLEDLKTKLSNIWNLKDWRLVSLGRGYFHGMFQSKEEKDPVWFLRALSLNPVALRLRDWSLDFNPALQKLTNAHICVRSYD